MVVEILASFLIAQSVEFTPLPLNTEPVWGTYFTASTAIKPHGLVMSQELKNKGSSLIVVDTQYGGGRLAYPSQLPRSIELGNTGDLIKDPAKLVEDLHEQGYYVIARYVLLKQGLLAQKRPDWALKNKSNRRPFTVRDGLVWLDPSHPEVKQYLMEITQEIAGFGFDEIQFDYVRFPEAGKGARIFYTFADDGKKTRDQAITDLVKDLATVLHWMDVPVSVDVFGIVVWNNLDWKLIGQNIPELAKYVDYISPMVYASHYSPGFLGYRNPADGEYRVVRESMEKFLIQTAGTNVRMRPWLQGFAMKTSRFGPQYVQNQAKAVTDIGIEEFLIWNASNNYWATMKANF